jgi:cysteine desulfurase
MNFDDSSIANNVAKNTIQAKSNNVVYLDYQSTTPIDPRVKDKIITTLDIFGNPHSRTHKFAWQAEEECEIAREHIAKLIGADSKDIVFTSGATESNNLALEGLARFYGDSKKHIITVCTEHKCVINSARYLESIGFKVTFLPVDKYGIIDLNQLESLIDSNTLVVSVMAVNNEIGVIQPLEQIGQICSKHGVFFHTDAAQAFGKIPLDVNKIGIDLMSISAHKIYGPKGIGALYIRRKPKRVKLLPIIQGGGQERGIRSGTLATPIIAGFGEAAKIALNEMDADNKKVSGFFDRFCSEIVDKIPEIYLNGHRQNRYKGNINISFGFIEGESMIMAIRDLAVSSGSACTSASLEPSYVIKAIGVSSELAHTSIRIGFGRMTTDTEIDFAIKLIQSKIQILRDLSPLWEMYNDGIDITKIEWSGH